MTGKRSKTEADHKELSRLEFESGLYADEKGKLIIPSRVLEALMISGSKKFKEGPLSKSGAFIEKDSRLTFKDQNLDAKDLFKKDEYILRLPVKVGQASLMRTRPIFKDWSIDLTITYFPDVCDPDQIIRWFQRAGEVIGLCDYRPRYGRFSVSITK